MSGQDTYRQGFAALQAGELEVACTAFEAVLTETPRHVGTLTYRGVALARLGRYDEAESQLRLACQLDPVATLPQYNLGRLFQITSRRDEAVECYRTVLQLDRRHAAARRELAALQADRSADEPLLDEPPSGDLAVWEVEPGNGLLHGLLLCCALAVPPLVASLVAVLVTGTAAWWSPGGLVALIAGGAPFGMLLCALAIYPSVARRRGPVVVEWLLEGEHVRMRAIDAYAIGRNGGLVALVFALLCFFIGLPALMMVVSFLSISMFGDATPAEQMASSVSMVIIAATATALLPLAGCTFLGTVSLTGLYNWLAAKGGGLRFRHRYHQRYSELLRLDVAASWRALTATLLPPAVMAGLVLALAAASRPLPEMIGLGLAPVVVAVLGPPAAMILYNGAAGRFGGVRLALAEE